MTATLNPQALDLAGERRYQLVDLYPALDELPDGVLVVEDSGKIERANAAFCQLFACDARDVVGKPLEELVAEEDTLRLLGFEAVFHAGSEQDNTILFIDEHGDSRAYSVSGARSAVYQHWFLTLRPHGRTHAELADTSRWAAEEQDRAQEFARARDALAAKNEELRAAQHELQTAHGKLTREVENRERLEGELRLAQKLESIGQLAAGIAHEINTPMQYVGDNVAFLNTAFQRIAKYLSELDEAIYAPIECMAPVQAKALELGKAARLGYLMAQLPKALSASQEGIAHVSKIVAAMKSFARADPGEKGLTDVNRCISDTVTVAQNEYKNIARLELCLGELPPVNCFAGKLNQVILNLVVNAAHAIADSGREGLGQITVCSRAIDGLVEITIGDNGIGIPEAISHKIFDPFFTTKAVGRGTGQGLPISRSIIVDAHGGTLSFETELGQGTTFKIRLPTDGAAKLEG